MQFKLIFLILFITTWSNAQYLFSGEINPEQWDHTVYLSVVEDYRKLEGIYTDQVIAKTKADSLGYFEFKGSILDKENRIYRIHIDKCTEDEQDFTHFNGYCENSLEVMFIANNTDTLHLPFTYDREMFCLIESNNPKADAFIKIDSIKNEMRFAYSEVRSEASRKLNNRNWFEGLQSFGKNLNEPIAELAIYSYLSDRRNEFYDYYLEDLATSNYYDELKTRLEQAYPGSNYTKQYVKELEADRFSLGGNNEDSRGMDWKIVLYILLSISIATNMYLMIKKKREKTSNKVNLKSKLSNQEQVVLEHILENKTNKEIAEALFLSVSTVKSHTNNIYKKLNVQSREDVKSLFNK